AFFLAYALSSSFAPTLIWVFCHYDARACTLGRALAFNAHNSSYRSMRFGFVGKISETEFGGMT
ncbi:MAG: hypothetical protein ACR2P3_07695, partial [Geminicoccaceae bacterium]